MNEYVSNNTCVACADGYENDAGDDPTGDDTSCVDLFKEEIPSAKYLLHLQFQEKFSTCSNRKWCVGDPP